MPMTGENAIIVRYSSVFGIRRTEVRQFQVSEITAYAQYSASVVIKYILPRKRKGIAVRILPDNSTYYLIESPGCAECYGCTLYDSRQDVPCDMAAWQATQDEMRQRFPSHGGARDGRAIEPLADRAE
jgi:hypothetical protein